LLTLPSSFAATRSWRDADRADWTGAGGGVAGDRGDAGGCWLACAAAACGSWHLPTSCLQASPAYLRAPPATHFLCPSCISTFFLPPCLFLQLPWQACGSGGMWTGTMVVAAYDGALRADAGCAACCSPLHARQRTTLAFCAVLLALPLYAGAELYILAGPSLPAVCHLSSPLRRLCLAQRADSCFSCFSLSTVAALLPLATTSKAARTATNNIPAGAFRATATGVGAAAGDCAARCWAGRRTRRSTLSCITCLDAAWRACGCGRPLPSGNACFACARNGDASPPPAYLLPSLPGHGAATGSPVMAAKRCVTACKRRGVAARQRAKRYLRRLPAAACCAP